MEAKDLMYNALCEAQYATRLADMRALGCVNAIQEMLMFTAPGVVRLLPACPSAFSKWSARLCFETGVCAMQSDLGNRQCHGVITAVRETDLRLELSLGFGVSPQAVKLHAGEQFEF